MGDRKRYNLTDYRLVAVPDAHYGCRNDVRELGLERGSLLAIKISVNSDLGAIMTWALDGLKTPIFSASEKQRERYMAIK